MKAFRLKLGELPFWFLNEEIRLDQENNSSGFINIEDLSDEEKLTINLSLQKLHVFAFDAEKNRLPSLGSLIIEKPDLFVDIEDIEEDDNLPEIISITEEEIIEVKIEEEDYEEASLLLKKNGNTVKKTIKEIYPSKTNEGFLHACLELEKLGANRKSIMSVLLNKKETLNE